MVQLPRRPQRKVVDSSSDDAHHDEVDGYGNGNGTKSPKPDISLPERKLSSRRLGNASGARSVTGSATSTPTTSPQKVSKTIKRAQPAKSAGSKSIYSFFNAATQKQKGGAEGFDKGLEAKEERVGEVQEDVVEDVIEDSYSETDKPKIQPLKYDRNVSLESGKRSRNLADVDSREQGTRQAVKFLKQANGARVASPGIPHNNNEDPRPWTEKYSPINVDELAVHKKKISDVRQWFDAVFDGKSYKRLLLLNGGAGTGKTATVNMISKSLEFELIEWSNPAFHDFQAEGLSLSAQFEDFIGRGRKFGGLEMSGTQIENSNKLDGSSAGNKVQRQAIVVEDFPNVLTKSTDTLQRFRSTIAQYLAANTPSRLSFERHSQIPPIPIVMIMTESVSSNNSFSNDNFTAHRLFGPDILTHPGVTVIEFNPIAPTILSKALELVLQKHARSTGKRHTPSALALQKLAEIGDVRNATSTLEFLCLQTSTKDVATEPIILPKTRSSKVKSKVRSKPVASVDPADIAAMSIINLRENTLGLFHATGKVVYNKRAVIVAGKVTTHNKDNIDDAPSHLSHLLRPLPSEVNIPALLDSSGTDPSTFIASLHENYLLSCTPESNDAEQALDSAIGCLESFCTADVLERTIGLGGGTFAGTEGLRQAEIAFELGVRGVLYNLPYPVSRKPLFATDRQTGSRNGRGSGPRNAEGGGKTDAHRMFYPKSAKLWRAKEEVMGMLDLAILQSLKNGIQVRRDVDGGESGNVEKSLKRNHNATSRHPSTAFSSFPTKTHSGNSQNHEQSSLQPPSEQHAPTPMTANLKKDNEKQESEALTSSYFSLGSGHSPRHEMLLERLPYLMYIVPPSTSTASSNPSKNTFHRTSSFVDSLLQKAESISKFSTLGAGLAPFANDDNDDNDEDEDEHNSTVEQEGISRGSITARERKSRAKSKQSEASVEEADVPGVEKLVLSDDDIVDDWG